MAWLIEQRRALKGKIDWARRRLAYVERAVEEVPRKLVELEAKLSSVDAVFLLHEVQVEPQKIKGKRAKRKALLPCGVLTKSILPVLRQVDQPLLTSVVAARVTGLWKEPLGWEGATSLRQRTRRRTFPR